MSRIVLLALIVLVLFWLLRRALVNRKRADKDADRQAGAQPPGTVPELVACARCGVHLPRNEALTSADGAAPAEGAAPASEGMGPVADRFFCSEEHRRLGPR